MPRIDIEVKGTKEAVAKFDRLIGLNFSKEFGEMKDYLVGFYKTMPFASEGAVLGRTWAPLAASTLRSKARRYPGRGILVASGAMRAGFKGQSTGNSLLISNPVRHFAFHQKGTRRMPSRVSMELDQPRTKRVIDILKAGLDRRVREI